MKYLLLSQSKVRIVTLLLLFCIINCSTDNQENASRQLTVSIFNPDSENFFDLPFPSEMFRKQDGHIDLRKFPNPRNSIWIRKLVQAVSEDNKGFGTNSAIYFRFSAPIDIATLPRTFAESTSSNSSVMLVNLDKESENFGKKIPIETFFREKEGFMWLPNMLVILPARGFVLDGNTLHCAIITDEIKDTRGRAITRDRGFTKLIDDTPENGNTFSEMELLHRKAMEYIEEIGVNREKVINIALFRTMNPVNEMELVAKKIYDEVAIPEITDISLTEQNDYYYLFEGHYSPNPVFQSGFSTGLYPYETEGGEFKFDENGEPIIDGEEILAFAITVPRTPMPQPRGYPVLLYAHGTGGNYLSFVEDETALNMAKLGIAVFGIDNSMNGTRIPPDKNPEFLFFNVQNMRAGRDNNRQAAADVIQQERLAMNLKIDSSVSPTGTEINFDEAKIMFMGHSQGGLNGSLYLALSKNCKAGYLSGSAGNLIYSIAYKTSPLNILAAIGLVVGLTSDDIKNFDFGIYHPLINLIQMFIEPADPINYAKYWFAKNLEGREPKNILQIEGIGDTFAPNPGIQALGVAGRLPPVKPIITPVESFDLMGLMPVEKPVTENITSGSFKITAGYLQYEPPPDIDGHFVTFYNQNAIETWTGFFATTVEGHAQIK